MSAGFEVYAPDGSLQLSSTTKIIANDINFATFTSVDTTAYDFLSSGTINPATFAYLPWYHHTSKVQGYNPDTGMLALRPLEGKTMILDSTGGVSAAAATSQFDTFGKIAVIPVEYSPPTVGAGDDKLVMYDQYGNPVWSIDEFVKSPQVISFAHIGFAQGVPLSQSSPIFYEVPENIDISKVFVIPLPHFTLSWDMAQTEGGFGLYMVAVTRVGRRFYVWPFILQGYAGMAISSVDNDNRSTFITSQTFGTGVDVLFTYIHSAPST